MNAILEYTVPEKPKSKYTFEETERGVIIRRECGKWVEIFVTDDKKLGLCHDQDAFGRSYALFSVDHVMDAAARHFIDKYKFKDERLLEATRMIVTALSGRFTVFWRKMIERVTKDEYFLLTKKMWASTHTQTYLLDSVELYEERFKHFRQDLLNYHACRLFSASVTSDTWRWNTQSVKDAHILLYCERWREHLCHEHASPKIVNKILDTFPPAVPQRLMYNFAQVPFQSRPTSRLHLLSILLCAEHFGGPPKLPIFLNTTHQEILAVGRAFPLWEGQSKLKGNPSTSTISELVSYLCDYPDPHHGDLMGLLRKAIRWHEVRERERQRMESEWLEKQKAWLDTELPAPPIDFTPYPEITFLSTVRALKEEDRLMNHCVGDYDTKAAQGRCYLFHVDYEGETATIEVDDRGSVVQAYGPRNRKNKASAYGTRLLNRLFRGLNYPPLDDIPF